MAMAARKARVLVVDDHPMMRAGLIQLINQQIDLACCGEAGTAAEAQAAVGRLKPDVVILDLRLKGGDGLELIKSLVSQFAGLRILVLTQYDAPHYVERALRAGALGYVVKEEAAEAVLGAVRAVLAGEVYLTRALAGRVLHTFIGSLPGTPRAGVEQLTDRELHVLQLLGAGFSTRKIATELMLSFKTIETHRENIKRKLGLRGAAELVHFASEWAREGVCLDRRSVTDATGADRAQFPLPSLLTLLPGATIPSGTD
jgi:two-component system, NarL family, response regulator NreC